MCISIVLGIKAAGSIETGTLDKQVIQRVMKYGYGHGIGQDALFSEVAQILTGRFPEYRFYEIHDVQEPHCACDIDQDIRNKSKTGEKSPFFEMINDIMVMEALEDFFVFFADKDSIIDQEIREMTGGLGEFFDRLNKWYTWQEEGYEPTRNAYYIAERSPLLFRLFKRREH